MAALETAQDEALAWAQVADLTPRLAPHVDIVKHHYRGQEWYVLADRMSASHFRCTPAVERLLSLLDGQHSLEQAYAACHQAMEGDAPGREEVLRLLAQMQSARLLLGAAPAASSEDYARTARSQKTQWLRRFSSPLAMRFPLVDPDALFARAVPWLEPLFKPVIFWLWFVVVAVAGITAISQSQALGAHWDARFLDPGNLLYLWLLYPLVKGLHELGHGMATRVWGGEVHEIGIMLLVFVPVPYVDASASSSFPSRHRRMVVAAAGIMVELLLSALALAGWIYSGPGLMHDLCFNVMVIGGLSTLLFNGNPLLRFDGYYVFSDLLEIPNLRSRANQYLGYLLQRYLLDLQVSVPTVAGSRERVWLLGYAVLAGVYRLTISFAIALYIAGKFFFIGSALALWLIVFQLTLPFCRLGLAVLRRARGQALQGRFYAVTGSVASLVLVLLFVVPLPDSNHVEGIVKLPQNARVRTAADGFVSDILARPGELVRQGTPLLELENLELRTREAVLLAKARELSLRHSAALSGEPIEVEILKREISVLDQEVREVQVQLDHLTVRSPHDGVFSLPGAADLPGRFVAKGELIGHVIDHSGFSVRVVVPQSEIDRVLTLTQVVEIRLASNPGQALAGGKLKQVPLATRALPSALLGSRAGGDIPVDARDEKGRQSLSSIFQLDVALPPATAGAHLGQGAFVRFVYQREPLGIGWIRRFRQLLITRLGI